MNLFWWIRQPHIWRSAIMIFVVYHTTYQLAWHRCAKALAKEPIPQVDVAGLTPQQISSVNNMVVHLREAGNGTKTKSITEIHEGASSQHDQTGPVGARSIAGRISYTTVGP